MEKVALPATNLPEKLPPLTARLQGRFRATISCQAAAFSCRQRRLVSWLFVLRIEKAPSSKPVSQWAVFPGVLPGRIAAGFRPSSRCLTDRLAPGLPDRLLRLSGHIYASGSLTKPMPISPGCTPGYPDDGKQSLFPNFRLHITPCGARNDFEPPPHRLCRDREQRHQPRQISRNATPNRSRGQRPNWACLSTQHLPYSHSMALSASPSLRSRSPHDESRPGCTSRSRLGARTNQPDHADDEAMG